MDFDAFFVVSLKNWNDENWDLASQEAPDPLPGLTEALQEQITPEVEKTFMNEITLECNIEDHDPFTDPEEDFWVDPRQAELAHIREVEARLARRREEREASDIALALLRLKPESLDAEIARLEARVQTLLETAEDLRREAARVSPSSADIWLGESLSKETN